MLLAACFLLSGCVTLTDYNAGQDFRADIVAEVQPGAPVEQTFISRRARLNSIQLWLQPVSSQEPDSRLKLSILREQGTQAGTAVERTYTYRELTSQFPLTVRFDPLDESAGQVYTLRLEAEGGPVRVLGRSEDAYPDGEFSIAQQESTADMAFRLTYDYDLAALGEDMLAALRNLWLVIPALLALWLPGRALLLAMEKPGKRLPFDWGARSALAVGLSLATAPVAMIWTTALGLQWSRMGVWGGMIGLAGVYAWRKILFLGTRNPKGLETKPFGLAMPETRDPKGFRSKPLGSGDLANVALCLIILGSLGVRLVMVRDLATPAWVDSVHHAAITRLILEQGAIPQTYAPLQESVSAAYHAGYHVSLAVFTWLSGLPLHTSMLVYGQILNALAALSAYLFTTTVFKNRLAGLLAALLTAFFSPMPAYYASWGRYTQLAGLLILPACITLLVWLRQDQQGNGWRAWLNNFFMRQKGLLAITGMALGGLYITHYRVAGFLVVLAGCEILVENLYAVLGQWVRQASAALRKIRMREAFPPGINAPVYETAPDKSGWMSKSIAGYLLAGVLGLALTAPWWPSALQALILPRMGAGTGAKAATPRLFADFSWQYLTAGAGEELMWLALAGLVLAAILHWRAALKLSLWVGLLFVLANLRHYRLPGGGFINNTSVEIALYLPLSAIAGYGLARVISAPRRWLAGKAVILYAIPWVALCAWSAWFGARQLLPLLNPATILSRQDDLPAMQWIEANIPAGQTILINPFRWGYGLYAGNDGGYWITPLSGHPTLPPTLLVSYSGQPQLAQQATKQTRQAVDAADDPATLHSLLGKLGIEYIYLGARGGPLSAQELLESGLFEAVYHYRATWVLMRR